MAMRLKERILALPNEKHREALFWFLERSGQEIAISYPMKTSSGIYLATAAAGIHKPSFSEYVLSIRSSTGKGATELYSDKEPVLENDGSWTYLYRHEMNGDESPETIWRNKALIKNMHDAVPVAVIRQLYVGRYQILGLAYVADYNTKTGYFFLMGTSAPEVSNFQNPAVSNEQLNIDFDARKFQETQRAVREGQGKFRQDLLNAYGVRCAATDFDISEGLEAAHIRPYFGFHTNDPSNGILLRADIHNLFDHGIVGVDPMTMKIVLNQRAKGSKYTPLHGQQLRLPSNPALHPSCELLLRHLKLHGITLN
jgi:putative restriction endonuclease